MPMGPRYLQCCTLISCYWSSQRRSSRPRCGPRYLGLRTPTASRSERTSLSKRRPEDKDRDAVIQMLIGAHLLLNLRGGKLRFSYHVLSTQVLHNLDLIKVKRTLEAVRCLELGRPGVRHALVVTRRRIVLICMKDLNPPKTKCMSETIETFTAAEALTFQKHVLALKYINTAWSD